MAEEDTMTQDMMGMIMAIMMISIMSSLLAGPVQAAPPENGVPAGRNIAVTLKNPPTTDGFWHFMLMDYDATENRLVYEHGISEPAIFTDLPINWGLPLKIDLQVFKWRIPGEVADGVYHIQSYKPFLWDFDKMDWGTTPDPTYKELFLPAFGSYYFDFDTEAFTLA